MDKQQADKIAQWWCDRMNDSEKYDNGDPEFGGGIEILKAEGFKFKDTTVTEGQKLKFTNQLVSILTANPGRIEYLSVDYDPDPILEDCLWFASIEFNPFPIKTTLWVKSMTARIGYSGEIVNV